MGLIRDSFVIFKNWADAIEALPEEYQLECYKAVAKYGLTGEIPEGISAVSKALLVSFSVGMENSICKYNASVENGKKGGNPNFKKGQPNPYYAKNDNKDNSNITEITEDNQPITEDNQRLPTHNLNVNVNVNDNVNIKREKYIKREKSFKNYLSLNFPKITLNEFECDTSEFDFDRLKQAIGESKFLQSATLSFIFENYNKVISGGYKSFGGSAKKVDYEKRSYTKEQMDEVFNDLDDVDL